MIEVHLLPCVAMNLRGYNENPYTDEFNTYNY